MDQFNKNISSGFGSISDVLSYCEVNSLGGSGELTKESDCIHLISDLVIKSGGFNHLEIIACSVLNARIREHGHVFRIASDGSIRVNFIPDIAIRDFIADGINC